MPANTNQDTIGAIYFLRGEGVLLGAVTNPSFRTVSSVVFQVPLSMLKLFADSICLRDGFLPFQNMSMHVLDYRFDLIQQFSWCHVRSPQIVMPALDMTNISSQTFDFSVNLSFFDGTEPSSDAKSSQTHLKTSNPTHRKDVRPFLGLLRIDGIDESVCNTIAKIGPYSISVRGAGNLDIDILATNTDPFQSWFQSGNSPRSGSVAYVDADLSILHKTNFTGLSVRTIEPAFFPTPAKIHLSYSGIGAS